MNQQESIQVQQLGPILRRRAPRALAVAGVIFLASVVLAAVLPNVYEAYATILVQPQSISEKLVEPGVEEVKLNRRLNLMTAEILSRARLSRIIDELELYQDEAEDMTREEIILMMRDRIRVEPVIPELTTAELSRNQDVVIDTFRIFFQDRSSETVAAVANRLANDFIEEHIRERVRRSGESTEFIEAELDRLKARSREVEAQLARIGEENAGRLPSDLFTNQRMLERTLDTLRLRQIELAQAESDAQFYAGQEALQSLGSGDGDERETPPERQIDALELRLAEYRSKGFTEKHPDVVAVMREIEEHSRTLAEEAAVSAEGDGETDGEAEEDGATEGGGGGLAALGVAAERRRAELQVDATKADIERLQAEIDEIEQRIADTPRVEEQMSVLRREYDHLRVSTQDFSERQLVAMVSANMERRQKGEQFRVLESAFEPPDPIKPNRILVLVLGTLLGLAVGGAIGLAQEAVDPCFHAARELQAALQIPVLATIPRVMLEPDRRALRRRRLRVAAAAVLLTGVVFSGSIAGYVYVNGMPGPLAALLGEGEQTEGQETPGQPEARSLDVRAG